MNVVTDVEFGIRPVKDRISNPRQLHSWLAIYLVAFLPILALGAFYIDRVRFLGLLSLYGALSVGRIIYQVGASHWVLRQSVKGRYFAPFVTIIMAAYDEDPAVLRKSLRALSRQNYPNFEVIIADDGSSNGPVIAEICRELGAIYLPLPHGGKREAMIAAFDNVSDQSEYILTADSDTIWDKNATSKLVKTMLKHHDTGAATGYVAVFNPNVNLLTLLIHLRYYMAFNQERAAQSLFGAVTCVSGPMGIYRRDIIDHVKDRFAGQTFLGRQCTFGDDRHLTNLVFLLGYRVRYAPGAVCFTAAPTTLAQYIRQQARWGKSHWREMTVQYQALPFQSLYLSYDWIITLLLPFLLTLSLIHYAILAGGGQPQYILVLLAMMIAMSFVRVIAPLIQTKDLRFVLFSLYTVFHLFVLLPLKFYSLATVSTSGWGTRKTQKVGA